MINAVETERADFQLIYPFMTEDLGLRGAELSVYALIYSFTKGSIGQFHGSRDYIARKTGYSLRSVARALKSLTDKGFIIAERLKEYKTVVYRVRFGAVYKNGTVIVPRWHTCGDKMAHNSKYDEYISTNHPPTGTYYSSIQRARVAPEEVERAPYRSGQERLTRLLEKHEGFARYRGEGGVELDYIGEPLYDLKPHKECPNVRMTTEQYMRLMRCVGKEVAEEYIECLSDYIRDTGRVPHSCYRTIMRWVYEDMHA